jgi:Fic family protein
MNNQFKLTLYSTRIAVAKKHPWESLLTEQLKNTGSITPKEAARLWNVTTRAARGRLKKMVEEGIIHRIASSDKDPKAIFVIAKGA